MKLQNKVIIVTGGANGIGRQLVLLLLSRGARVAAVDISEPALNETAQLAGTSKERLSLHKVDITNRKAIEALPEAVLMAHGQVDGLINNAGIIQPFVRVNELNYEQIDKVMQVNFYGLLYMTKTFLPHFLKRPEAHIVNLSSMGGFLPVPGQSIYGAAKAAVNLLTEALYSELLDTNVRVTVVYPGAINTDISINSGVMSAEQRASLDTGKMKTTSPAFAAQVILDGVERNKFRVLVGSDARFMDFLFRFNPKFATEFIFKQMKSLLK